MSSPTEVIIYRNPLEYQLYNSGILFPIMCAAVVTIVVTVVLTKILESTRFWNFGAGRRWGYAPLALAFLCGALTLWKML